MCGIAGAVAVSTPELDLTTSVAAMTRVLRHRGPDDQGVWTDPSRRVALGHARLSIVDLGARAHQPMHSANGTWALTLNGEVYNFRLLAAELMAAGVALRSRSDTEVLVEALAHWGLKATLDRLQGMFAFAAYCKDTCQLHLVRDRAGIKPLYWTRHQGAVCFCSELKALRHLPGFAPRLNHAAIGHLLDYSYIPAPLTVFEDVHQLQPGTGLTIAPQGQPDKWRYWSGPVQAHRTGAAMTQETASAALTDILNKTMGQYLDADVEVGCFLSGGVDSALIAAIARQASGPRLKTFTIGFSEKSWDESADAARVAAHLGTDHRCLILTDDDVVPLVEGLGDTFDEPFADFSQLPTLALSRFASAEVKVCLAGDGGDELFGGYERYAWAPDYWAMVARLPDTAKPFAPRLFKTLSTMGVPIGPRLWDTPRWRHALLEEIRARFRSTAMPTTFAGFYDALRRTALDPVHRLGYDSLLHPGARAGSPLDAMQGFDFEHFLPDCNLTKVDRTSMSVGLEVRTPFLAEPVMDFASDLPPALRVARGQLRPVQRNALRRHLPDALVDRPKMGFGFPLDDWLRSGLRDWAEDLLSQTSLQTLPFLNAAQIRSLWSDHVAGRAAHRHSLWPVLMMLNWHRRWMT
ncbi:MAG: asparagine synthase (glutamine-hydrolyzing) [Pseudomonadota bacterium]